MGMFAIAKAKVVQPPRQSPPPDRSRGRKRLCQKGLTLFPRPAPRVLVEELLARTVSTWRVHIALQSTTTRNGGFRAYLALNREPIREVNITRQLHGTAGKTLPELSHHPCPSTMPQRSSYHLRMPIDHLLSAYRRRVSQIMIFISESRQIYHF